MGVTIMIDAAGNNRWRAAWVSDFAIDFASGGGMLQEVNVYVSACCGCKLGIEIDERGPWWITRWIVRGTESRLVIGRLLNGQRRDRLQWRIFSIIPMLGAYLREFPDPPPGEVPINL